ATRDASTPKRSIASTPATPKDVRPAIAEMYTVTAVSQTANARRVICSRGSAEGTGTVLTQSSVGPSAECGRGGAVGGRRGCNRPRAGALMGIVIENAHVGKHFQVCAARPRWPTVGVCLTMFTDRKSV